MGLKKQLSYMVLHVQAEGSEFRSQHSSLKRKLASCLSSQHQGDRDKQISGSSVPCLAKLEVSLSKKQTRLRREHLASTSDLHTHRKTSTHACVCTLHLWQRTETEGRYWGGHADSAAICHLWLFAKRMSYAGSSSGAQHRPAQA